MTRKTNEKLISIGSMVIKSNRSITLNQKLNSYYRFS